MTIQAAVAKAYGYIESEEQLAEKIESMAQWVHDQTGADWREVHRGLRAGYQLKFHWEQLKERARL